MPSVQRASTCSRLLCCTTGHKNSLLHDTALWKTSSTSKAASRSASAKASNKSHGGSPTRARFACLHVCCPRVRLSADADVAFAVSGCRICLLLFSSPTRHLLSLSCRIGHPADQDVNVPLGKASLQTSRRTLSLPPPFANTPASTTQITHRVSVSLAAPPLFSALLNRITCSTPSTREAKGNTAENKMFDAQSLRLVDGKCPEIGTVGLTLNICGPYAAYVICPRIVAEPDGCRTQLLPTAGCICGH